ncbi:MAG: AMP-binding protein, partial [Marinobacter alexandrii]|uniref:AMP-binding protein n=1 Tax=Marinobacter alexandrii TaxID=2570351 RepID=UPI0032971560
MQFQIPFQSKRKAAIFFVIMKDGNGQQPLTFMSKGYQKPPLPFIEFDRYDCQTGCFVMTASSNQQTVISRFIKIAQDYPGRTAVAWQDNQTWKELTYTQLFDKARAIASNLVKAGVKEGSPVILPSERH